MKKACRQLCVPKRRTTGYATIVVALSLASSTVLAECDTSKLSKPATSRFVIKGDTVYDKKTDLIWMRCSQGQRWKEDIGCVGVPQKFTFKDANAGWTNGWRMPTKDELLTIVASYCSSPTIDDEIFPDTDSGDYWTSSKDGSYCWVVDFRDGRASHYFGFSFDYCDFDYAVRLVRGGQ